MVELKVKKLVKEAKVPSYSIPGDAGLDLFSVEDKIIPAGKRVQVKTGIALEYPPGYCGLIWEKSGLAHKEGLITLGGVFEHTYRGEYIIGIFNSSDHDYQIEKGQKIAQLLIQPIATVQVKEVKELSRTKRGDGAFGSTGQ